MQSPTAKFQHYLARNLRYLTQLVASAQPLPDETLRVQAMHSLSYALGQPELWPVTRQLLLTLAPKMEQAGHRSDWLAYLEQATQVSEQQQDWAAAAECYLQRGLLHRLLSEFPLAIERLQVSVALGQQIGAARAQARALNELAWVAYLQQQTTSATAYVEQALALLAVDDPERAMCYRVQGMIAITLERWVEAEALHRQALAGFEAQGDQRKTAWSLQNLAYALRGERRYEEAIGYYQQAAELLQLLADRHNWAVVLFNLGIAYYHYGKIEDAIANLRQAAKIFTEMGNKLFLARIHTDLGLAFLAQRQWLEAEKMFIISMEYFQQLHDEAWGLNAADGLAMTYLAQGKYEQAIELLESALTSLPKIKDAPNYNYLFCTLNERLIVAQRDQNIKRGQV